jgi:hypothetical protein
MEYTSSFFTRKYGSGILHSCFHGNLFVMDYIPLTFQVKMLLWNMVVRIFLWGNIVNILGTSNIIYYWWEHKNS